MRPPAHLDPPLCITQETPPTVMASFEMDVHAPCGTSGIDTGGPSSSSSSSSSPSSSSSCAAAALPLALALALALDDGPLPAAWLLPLPRPPPRLLTDAVALRPVYSSSSSYLAQEEVVGQGRPGASGRP
jgi:hypothetical protein